MPARLDARTTSLVLRGTRLGDRVDALVEEVSPRLLDVEALGIDIGRRCSNHAQRVVSAKRRGVQVAPRVVRVTPTVVQGKPLVLEGSSTGIFVRRHDMFSPSTDLHDGRRSRNHRPQYALVLRLYPNQQPLVPK